MKTKQDDLETQPQTIEVSVNAYKRRHMWLLESHVKKITGWTVLRQVGVLSDIFCWHSMNVNVCWFSLVSPFAFGSCCHTSSLLTRSKEQRDSPDASLHKLCVDAHHVRSRQAVFIVSVADCVNPGKVRHVAEQNHPLEEWLLGLVPTCRFKINVNWKSI